MKKYLKLAAILSFLLLLTSCAVNHYSVTQAQSQGTTIRGMRKLLSYGNWIKTYVSAIDHQGITSTGSFWEGATYSAPVIPNQPHTFDVSVRYMNGLFEGQYAGQTQIHATLQSGQHYFVNGKYNGKNLDVWIQSKSGKRVTPKVLIHCTRISIL